MGLAISAFFVDNYIKESALHALPYGFKKFSFSESLPACARWKDHMPANRAPATYHLYIEARKLWRSKIEWQLIHEESTKILTDVRKAADLGDWGARALMAHFYLEGLGPLESNEVLKPDPYKAVEFARMAAKEMQPWGLYDLGVAHEHGYGGAHYDVDLAWAYYLKAAQLGSPEAQMALAGAYAGEGRLSDEKIMLECAYQQGHGPAAYRLGIKARIRKEYPTAFNIYQQGVKFGSQECASALWLLFDGDGSWPSSNEEEKSSLKLLGIVADSERGRRYREISEALQINPDLKLSKLDEVLPLPPAQLPPWTGVASAIEPESNAPPTY
ncbi:tetratricopeptide repeat protein [Janthinobacterium sp. RB2R34]